MLVADCLGLALALPPTLKTPFWIPGETSVIPAAEQSPSEDFIDHRRMVQVDGAGLTQTTPEVSIKGDSVEMKERISSKRCQGIRN